MWRWYTADDRRNATAVLAILTILCLAMLALVPIVTGVLLVAVGGGDPAEVAPFRRWAAILVALVQSPGDPGQAFGIAGAFGAVVFWLITTLLALVAVFACVVLSVGLWRATAPTGTGYATRTDVNRDLSLAVCRQRARTSRPDLDRKQRRQAKPAQVGIPLHQAPVTRTDLWLPLENATGVIAPQQSGKTLMDLIHKVLAAPAGLITTSTKLDLFLLTATTRERGGSKVSVLDLTGILDWPRRVRWNPIRGCTTAKTAKRRAQALLRATTGDGLGGGAGSNHGFFERRAVDVMTAYLLAAGLSGATVAEFVGWCQNDTDTEAGTVLRGYPEYAAIRRTLQQAQGVVDETRSGIWETIRDAIACLTDPDVTTSALPLAEDRGFDPDTFVRSGGTVYVIGSEDDAATQAPLITAFVQEVLDAARRQALTTSRDAGYERLAPPFTAVLDEIANICPLPDLPDTLSDSAGRGVLVHYALQSPAQAQARWGKAAATLFDNTTALTILGGLKSEDTLKWASLLVGRRLEERRSRQLGRGFTDPGSVHLGAERVDTLEPAAIRQIPRGRALLIIRSMPALIVHLKPAWKRSDWTTLQADAKHLRASGQAHRPRTELGQPGTVAVLR